MERVLSIVVVTSSLKIYSGLCSFDLVYGIVMKLIVSYIEDILLLFLIQREYGICAALYS